MLDRVLPNSRLLTLAAATLLAFALSGCASNYQLKPTEVNPSASGELKVKEEDNDNYKVDLEVEHMAPPRNIGPSMRTYIVWLNPKESNEYIKAGQLKISDRSRDGELEFTTPYSNFEVVVTAEPAKDVVRPSDKVVLRQSVKAG